jgi:hypothetical protein
MSIVRNIGNKFYGTGIGKYSVIDKLTSLYFRNKKTEIKLINGMKIIVEPNYDILEKILFFSGGITEHEETKVFMGIINKTSTFVDIGGG